MGEREASSNFIREEKITKLAKGVFYQNYIMVIDIGKSKLTIKSATKQINELYSKKSYNWLNKVVIKKHNDYIVINKPK